MPHTAVDEWVRARGCPKLVSLIKDPVFQAYSQWNDIDPELRWKDKVAFKSQIKYRLLDYFNRHWRSDKLSLYYEGKSIIANPVE